MSSAAADLSIGAELVSEPYLADARAELLYAQAAAVRRHPPGKDVHIEPETARRMGFKGPILSGPQTYAFLARFIADKFGVAFLCGGALDASFVKPVFYGDRLTAHLRLLRENGDAREFEAWVENQDGVKLAIGKASVRRTP
ncbi:MAG TPA: MaoC family dehydratase [Candidatus Binataceae bacterium]|nr:MaoC family dehydratase [Candidatus Binataceae bacterium]